MRREPSPKKIGQDLTRLLGERPACEYVSGDHEDLLRELAVDRGHTERFWSELEALAERYGERGMLMVDQKLCLTVFLSTDAFDEFLDVEGVDRKALRRLRDLQEQGSDLAGKCFDRFTCPYDTLVVLTYALASAQMSFSRAVQLEKANQRENGHAD